MTNHSWKFHFGRLIVNGLAVLTVACAYCGLGIAEDERVMLGVEGLSVEIPKQYDCWQTETETVVCSTKGEGVIRFFVYDEAEHPYSYVFRREYPDVYMSGDGEKKFIGKVELNTYPMLNKEIPSEEMLVLLGDDPVEPQTTRLVIQATWDSGYHQKKISEILSTLRQQKPEPRPETEKTDESKDAAGANKDEKDGTEKKDEAVELLPVSLTSSQQIALGKLIDALSAKRMIRPKFYNTLCPCVKCEGKGVVECKAFLCLKICDGGIWKVTTRSGRKWEEKKRISWTTSGGKPGWDSKACAAEWCETCGGTGQTPYRTVWTLCPTCDGSGTAEYGGVTQTCKNCNGLGVEKHKVKPDEKRKPVIIPLDEPLITALKKLQSVSEAADKK